jgi:hypothetical protein
VPALRHKDSKLQRIEKARGNGGRQVMLTPQTLFCVDCGKNFVHYVGGMPQKVCGVCAGVDSDMRDE